jgi:CheY-like chemotaxis protein
MAEKLKAVRLLIVDDSGINRKIVKRVLEGKFHCIDEAENGAEALRMIQSASDQRQPYDLVMMDSHMPVMNGLEAAKAIKVSYPCMKIIGVTGNALKSDLDNFVEAGADKVMVKPLNLEEFFNYVFDIYITNEKEP